MINSQEIIERSIYLSILETLVSVNYTLDPQNYYPITPESEQRYKSDLERIMRNKGKYIYLFGIGNNQSKGMKELLPRIVIDAQGFLPGDIGLPKTMMVREKENYVVSESPFEAIDQWIDIHLVSNTSEDNRLLLNILSTSIPQRGYIKPYTHEKVPFDGNIFIEAVNFYNTPNYDKGLIEKVYQFQVKDTLLDIKFGSKEEPTIIPPMVDISLLIQEPNLLKG